MRNKLDSFSFTWISYLLSPRCRHHRPLSYLAASKQCKNPSIDDSPPLRNLSTIQFPPSSDNTLRQMPSFPTPISHHHHHHNPLNHDRALRLAGENLIRTPFSFTLSSHHSHRARTKPSPSHHAVTRLLTGRSNPSHGWLACRCLSNLSNPAQPSSSIYQKAHQRAGCQR